HVSIALIEEISMWIQNFFQFLTPTPIRPRPTRRRPSASRLRLEALEDRALLSFAAPVGYSTGYYSSLAKTADLNGDGRLDLLATNYDWDSLSVLLGNGDGTFQAARTYATGEDPLGALVGD